MFEHLRKTSYNRPAAVIRVLLGLTFFTAGLLKVLVPHLGEAFSGQLTAAEIPLYTASLYGVPVAEMVVGVTLTLGLHARVSAALAAVMMLVATYVHVVVDDPALFPLQPVAPIGPLLLLVMLLYILRAGAGAWSIDLLETVHPAG